jgi:hypothetical protein
MEEKGPVLMRIEAILLVFAAIIVSSILISSLGKGGRLYQITGSPVSVGPGAAASAVVLLLALFIGIIVFDIVWILVRGTGGLGFIAPSTGRGKSRFLQNVIISLLFLFVLFGAYLLLAGKLHGLLGLNRTAPTSPLNSTGALDGIRLSGTALAGSIQPVLAIGVLLAAAAAFLAIATMIVQGRNVPRNSVETKEELTEMIECKITDLKGGSDPRSAILEVYRQMHSFLAGMGASDRSHWTVREFERRARDALSIKERTITDITSLFEEAKYSRHEMGERERRTAVELLENLVRDIRAGRG